MIKVETYIKDGDDFIPVEEFDGTIPDPDYIDSAMELTINGVAVITKAEWDYMVPLWAYISNGFEDLQKKSEWTTGFPDQPIDLTFRLYKENNKIEIVSTPSRGIIKAKANLDEFITVMSEAGQKFFLRMADLLPNELADYEYEAQRMEKVTIALRKALSL